MTFSLRKIDISRKCWRETEYMTPIYATLEFGLFWARDNQDPKGSREIFTSPLSTQKNLDRGAWFRERERELLPEITFIGMIYL